MRYFISSLAKCNLSSFEKIFEIFVKKTFLSCIYFLKLYNLISFIAVTLFHQCFLQSNALQKPWRFGSFYLSKFPISKFIQYSVNDINIKWFEKLWQSKLSLHHNWNFYKCQRKSLFPLPALFKRLLNLISTTVGCKTLEQAACFLKFSVL